MIRLRDILKEQSTQVPETIDQIWDGYVVPYGTRDTTSNGVVRQIQNAVVNKLKQQNKPTFKPDGVFGPTTAKAIASLLNMKLKNPKTLSVGPNTLKHLGFTPPQELPLSTKILAATITGEGMGDKADMKAIANVILNRAIARKSTPSSEAVSPKQFSMWNSISGDTIEAKTNNVIKNWGGGLKTSGNLPYWKYGIELAKQIEQKTLSDNTGGATHYFTGSRPYWANLDTYKLHKVIGKHEYGRDTSTSWAKKPVTR